MCMCSKKWGGGGRGGSSPCPPRFSATEFCPSCNLYRHSGAQDTKTLEVQARRCEVETELKSLCMAVSHMETDITRLQKDMAAVGKSFYSRDQMCIILVHAMKKMLLLLLRSSLHHW